MIDDIDDIDEHEQRNEYQQQVIRSSTHPIDKD
jgi:hypothetical protein